MAENDQGRDTPDEVLMARVKAGRIEALEVLVRRYRNPLFAFIYRQIGEGQEVEDVFQETWLRIVRSAGGYDETRRFTTWMFQIALNLCRDHYRKRSTNILDTIDEKTWNAIGSDEGDPSAGVERAEAQKLLVGALAHLPAEQREALELRYFQRLSEKEAARILGCPAGTVKSRLHNAIRNLRSVIREPEVNHGNRAPLERNALR